MRLKPTHTVQSTRGGGSGQAKEEKPNGKEKSSYNKGENGTHLRGVSKLHGSKETKNGFRGGQDWGSIVHPLVGEGRKVSKGLTWKRDNSKVTLTNLQGKSKPGGK